MIQSDKRPEQSDFANITDYSAQCSKGYLPLMVLFLQIH